MKRNIIRILLFVQAIMVSQIVCAQSMSSSEERKVMMHIVELFEDYRRYACIDEDFSNNGIYFRSLFENSDSPIFNDLYGIVDGQSLAVKEYIKIMTKQVRTARISVKNIELKRIYSENGRWKIECSFDKYVNLTSSCGIEYASDFFYAKDYKLTATIIYDSKNNDCKFEKILGSAEHIRTLPKDYRVLKRTSEKDNEILFEGKPLDFNAMGQAFIKPMGRLTYKDPEALVKMQLENDECNIWRVAVVPKTWRIKLHYNVNLGNSHKIEGNSLVNSKSSINNIGLDFGYVFPSKTILKTGVFIGLGFSQSKIDLSYTNTDYAFSTTADVDDDSYIRHYQDLDVKQGIKLTDLTIPIYADFNFHFNRIVNIFVDLGIKLHLNMSHKVESSEGSAYIYGIYPQYDNLRMDEHWGYNGFGNNTFGASNLNNSELLDVSGFTADAFGSIGLRFNIPQTPLAIDLGVSYQMGLTNVIKANDSAVSLSEVSDPSHALVYNTLNGLTNTEHLRNLTESFTSMKRQALMFNIGLIYKF